MKPDFYLSASENYDFARPRACYTVGGPRTLYTRRDCMLIRVEPALEDDDEVLAKHKVTEKSLRNHLLIGARLGGFDIWKRNEGHGNIWPKPVYASQLINVAAIDQEVISPEYLAPEFEWAEIYERAEDITCLPHTKLFLETGVRTQF